ncbi:MAG: cysteine desulfurase NifS [Clostridia bacterium]|nr:cysteine desulfurase NifS [Clostridia bacterium]
MERIYLDNAATTKLDERVFKEMMPYFMEEYGNPSSVYSLGKNARQAIEVAREKVAKAINADPSEIYFTSGGTESNITAIRGLAYSYRRRGNHIITTRIEHPVVLETCRQLENEGFEVTYLDVDENGIINLEKLEDSITDKTILITIMYANNEMGAIQPISEIGQIARENGIFFHTDSVQAIGNIKIDVKAQKIDSLSISAHKFYGPKGVGALYVRKGLKFKKMQVGGNQERNKRAGTENVPAIVGMGRAIELAYEEFDQNIPKIIQLKDYCIKEIQKRIKSIKINGDASERVPGNVNVSFYDIDAEDLINSLAEKDICVSNGSVCISGSLEPSHVLLAMEIPYELAKGTLRISIGKYNTKEEIDYTLDVLVEVVDKLRKMEKKEKATCKYASKCGGNCSGCH